MPTAFISVEEDGRCPHVKDGAKFYLGSTPITPATHFAFAPGLGARFAALLPFPAVAGSCGKLLEVLRVEEGYVTAQRGPKPKTKKGSKRGREDENNAQHVVNDAVDDQGDAADKDHFLLISACEPLDSDVFDLLCLMLTQYAGRADVHENTLWSHTVSFQQRVDEAAGTEVAQVCQLFRIAAFLQCEDLVTFCKTGLTGWCRTMSSLDVDANAHVREGVMEGLVRKSSLLIRNAVKRLSLDSNDATTRELLDKFEAWSMEMQASATQKNQQQQEQEQEQEQEQQRQEQQQQQQQQQEQKQAQHHHDNTSDDDSDDEYDHEYDDEYDDDYDDEYDDEDDHDFHGDVDDDFDETDPRPNRAIRRSVPCVLVPLAEIQED